jgi:hypothetical protein
MRHVSWLCSVTTDGYGIISQYCLPDLFQFTIRSHWQCREMNNEYKLHSVGSQYISFIILVKYFSRTSRYLATYMSIYRVTFSMGLSSMKILHAYLVSSSHTGEKWEHKLSFFLNLSFPSLFWTWHWLFCAKLSRGVHSLATARPSVL